MDNITDDELIAMDISYNALTQKFIEEGFNQYACAAAMIKLAFMIYKTSLNTEEYNLMIDTISDNRNKIKSFDELMSSSKLN